jgi:hypothetical protein
VESIRIQVGRDNDARCLDESLRLHDTTLRRTDDARPLRVSARCEGVALHPTAERAVAKIAVPVDVAALCKS